MKKTLLLVFIVLNACSFKKGTENQPLKGHKELYSEPSVPNLEKLEKFEKRIVIAATNDVHGHYQTHNLVFKDEHDANPQTIRIGGIDTIQNYFKILREAYANVILVDSGDIFSSAHSTNIVNEFYGLLKYDAISLGLSDFNLRIPSNIESSAQYFQNFSKKSTTPLLLSNLYELKTARVVEWEGTKPYVLKEIGGIKVGIIGILPNDIVEQTPVNNRVGFYIENMVQSTLRNARLLRSLGADIIVVLTHQGIDCNSELASSSKLPISKVNFEPKRSSVCDLDNSLGQYLERLPPQLVDVVVGGRNHQKMANFINGTLVLGSFPDATSFSFAEFIVNTKTKKIDPEQTVVHQPVMFCHEFFKETNDCYTEDTSVNHKDRIPATFLGRPIQAQKVAQNSDLDEKKISNFTTKDIAKSLVTFTTDIAYVSKSAGHTQLFVAAISGKELIKLLENDFNRGHKNEWQPYPFVTEGEELQLYIGGQKIDQQRTYKILTDLESLQSHSQMLKQINHPESLALKNYSWASYLEEKDSISTQMAAQLR